MDLDKIKSWIEENLLTKQEAMEITGQSLSAFNQAVSTRQLIPFYEKGTGRSQVRLYLKEDVEQYNQRRIEHLKKYNRK